MKFLVFGGGGKVARHFARHAVAEGHEVISVVRDDTHCADLKSLGATPTILSLENSSVSEITSLLTSTSPDTIIFSAGAGGKGGPERTRAVDYEGALKVFDAMENGNFRRLLYVSAMDIRDRSKGFPKYYNQESIDLSERMWKAIPHYMQAKYDAEVELHKHKQIQFTVIRPGGLTDGPAAGVEMGITQIRKTSRELVAKALLACAEEPGTAGLTIDVMDGDGDLKDELRKVVDGQFDAWIG